MSINKLKNLNRNFFIATIIAIIFLLPFSAKAELGDMDVIFSHDPLFQEIGILPGNTASETITVTNNTEEEKTVGIKFIGTSTFELDNVIFFEILENNTTLFGGTSDPKSLADLLNLGEISIVTIQPAETIILTINADFLTSVENPFQLKSSVFDINVGFIYFENNLFTLPKNTPRVLGDETENIIPEIEKNIKILGVELPLTGGQLILIFIIPIILLTFSVIILRLATTKKDSI